MVTKYQFFCCPGLSTWIRDKYSNPEWKHSLAGNLRMLLTCRNPILQQESQSNLRTILSREPNSQTKLPRFSTLIKIDLTHEDEILKKRKFLGKLNIPGETQNLDFPSRDVKDLVDILNLSPDYDVISRKNALEQLTLVMESKKSSLMCGSCHIRNGVEYQNCLRTLDVYFLFAIWMGQIQSKLIYIFVTYGLASL